MKQLSCQNEFCVYQNRGNCVLENIQLDIQGNCMECIYVNINEKILNTLKEKHLKKLE